MGYRSASLAVPAGSGPVSCASAHVRNAATRAAPITGAGREHHVARFHAV